MFVFLLLFVLVILVLQYASKRDYKIVPRHNSVLYNLELYLIPNRDDYSVQIGCDLSITLRYALEYSNR